MTATPSPQSVETGVSPIYTAAYDSIRKGAPGLSDATCQVIARSINMKVGIAPAPAPSSLAGGEVRDMSGETVMGMRVAAYRHPASCPPGLDRAEWLAFFNGSPPNTYCEHWSTPGEHRTDVERLFTEADVRRILAALSPEAPARDGVDLEGLLTTALTDELQDGGAEVPYSIIAERVAARVADEASAPSCTLTAAAEEALSFLQNAPLESGICCCGDPISGHGYGSGHSPVDDLAYHSSQVAEKLQAALTPRHEAPASAIDDLVDRFAVALKEKLHVAEAKYGHDDAWMRDDWLDDLIEQLGEHVQKGDPRDVAAYCAFAWHHGWSVSHEAPAEPCFECGSTERTGTACKPCNPEITDPNFGHEAPAEGAGERFTEGATLPDGAISGTDDGQTVWLESSTGGAHRLGIWGGLSLRFEEADGSSVVRDYEDVNLTPRHEAPASDGEREPLCMAYKTGYAEGVEDSNGMFDRESCEEGWGQYAEKLSAQPALPARLPLPTVDDGRGGRRPINPQDDR